MPFPSTPPGTRSADGTTSQFLIRNSESGFLDQTPHICVSSLRLCGHPSNKKRPRARLPGGIASVRTLPRCRTSDLVWCFRFRGPRSVAHGRVPRRRSRFFHPWKNRCCPARRSRPPGSAPRPEPPRQMGTSHAPLLALVLAIGACRCRGLSFVESSCRLARRWGLCLGRLFGTTGLGRLTRCVRRRLRPSRCRRSR